MVKDKYTYNGHDYFYRIGLWYGVKAIQALFINTKGELCEYKDLIKGIEKGVDIGVEKGCQYAFAVLHNAGTLLACMEINYPFRLFTKKGEIKNIEAFKSKLKKISDGYYHITCKEGGDCLEQPVTIYCPLTDTKAFPFHFVEFDENRKITKISWDEPRGDYMIKYNIKPEDYGL